MFYFSSASHNTCVFTDFIVNFNLYACIDLHDTIAPYNFINYTITLPQ